MAQIAAAEALEPPGTDGNTVPNYLILGGGWGLFKDTAEGNGAAAYLSHLSWHDIQPEAAVGVASHSSYVMIRALYSFHLDERFAISVGTGPGLYAHHETAPNLGSPVEFLSTLSISARTYGQQRLAVAVGHISNAHLTAYNPGSNLIELLYEIPLRL